MKRRRSIITMVLLLGAVLGRLVPLTAGEADASQTTASAEGLECVDGPRLVREGTVSMTIVPPRAIRIDAGEKATLPEKNAARLFAAEVLRRTGAALGESTPDEPALTLVLGTPESSRQARLWCQTNPQTTALGADGFYLDTRADAEGRIFLVGESPSGVVAGVGRLLSLCRYADDSVSIPEVFLSDTPRLPVRGMYFATHFSNFYHTASLEAVDRVIEDVALAGANSLALWFDMHHFRSLDDPQAQSHLKRLQHFAAMAQSLGMDVGLVLLSNEAYGSSPEELRIEPIPYSYGCEVCPSKPGGLEEIAECQSGVLDSFHHLDFIWAWPHDQGGCGCEKCAPWGGNGHLIASEQLARLFRERFPEGQVWLSTWMFDTAGLWSGEFDGLYRHLRDRRPDWLSGILHGGHTPGLHRPALERPMPERYPLTWFPETSMVGMRPWGSSGANPLPDLCASYFDDVRESIVGGWPYSEGIYEDVNKFLWIRHFWDPDRSVDDILADYASAYLDPDCADDFTGLAHLLEEDHQRQGWGINSLDGADEAWRLAQDIDARIRPWVRESWRWRVLYLRAQLDYVVRHRGYISPDARRALKPLCDELSSIYRVDENTRILVRPLDAPDPDAPAPDEAGNLAYNRPVRASSTYPEAAATDSQYALVDGILIPAEPQDWVNLFTTPSGRTWANDPTCDPKPWVEIDLGESTRITEIQVRFYHVDLKHCFTPSTIIFSVSDDGRLFAPVLETRDVPREGSAYSADLTRYPVQARGRYIRLDFGVSQRADGPDAGRITLSEVRVTGR